MEKNPYMINNLIKKLLLNKERKQNQVLNIIHTKP